MKTRGRDSAASQEIAHLARVDITQRPDAPYDLTDEQADEWRAVVSRMPADWFPRETHPLLTEYCRLVVRARRLAQLADQAEKAPPAEFDSKEYQSLVKTEGAISRDISSLATRMRLSQQGTYDAKKSKGKVTLSQKPWE